MYPLLKSLFLLLVKIFFLKIKKPLIGSDVFRPKKILTINIKILDALKRKKPRLCFFLSNNFLVPITKSAFSFHKLLIVLEYQWDGVVDHHP